MTEKSFHRGPADDAERTLRLVAELPPPSELTDRVHRRLSEAQRALPQHSFWSLWMPKQRLQFAGAALLVTAVVGSTWGVYHGRGAKQLAGQTGASSEQPVPGLASSPAGGGFQPAAAEARPTTLTPIRVPSHGVVAMRKKKPSASHAAAQAKPTDIPPAGTSAPTQP